MTILMTADTVGGVWTFALDLSRALGPRGVHVVLAAMGAPLSDAQRTAAARIPSLTVIDRPYRLEWMPEPWPDVEAAGEWLLDLARACQPDVVHVDGYAHAALPFAAPVVVTAHSCVLSWYRAVRRQAPPPEWRRYELAVRAGLDAARVIVTPTRAMALAVVRHYAPATPIVVVPNGREATVYAPGPKEPLVLSVGRLWDEAKNVAAVAAAAPQLPWPVYVAGDGPIPDGVTALGRLDTEALAGWYRRAAVYAAPSRYEPFGLAVLEAGLCGCALVLGDITSLRESWQDAAVFVDPEDTGALVAALSALIADPGRRRALGAQARRRAATFTADAMADAYRRLYQQTAAMPAVAEGRPTCAS